MFRGVKNRKRLDQRGQSTIEFALALVLLLAFILFYIQLTLVFGWANYIHYATFMSARAYLSASVSKEDQQERAQRVAIRMLKRNNQPGRDRIPFLAEGAEGGDIRGLNLSSPSQFKSDDRGSSWMEGVRYTFKSRLFLMPLAGKAKGGSQSLNSVTLTSESWLGREPTYQDCMSYMDKVGVFDNGC